MQSYPLLQVPISDLKLSESFKQMATCNGFRNLYDILQWPASVLLMHTDFSYHIYQELREFLKENEMIKMLKAGNS